MKTFFKFKTVSVSEAGDYWQIMFHDDLDTDDEPYFMIQSQFEFPDDGECHFESHVEELIEDSKVKTVSLSNSKLSLSYGNNPNHEVEIEYDLQDLDFQALALMLKKMIPEFKVGV